MTIESYLTGAILPTVFRQDPRYFQSGQDIRRKLKKQPH
jgi:hypothetical protein